MLWSAAVGADGGSRTRGRESRRRKGEEEGEREGNEGRRKGGRGQRVRANEGTWFKAVGNVREKGAEKD